MDTPGPEIKWSLCGPTIYYSFIDVANFISDPENLKKKSSIDVVAGESPNDSDTDETLDVTIDIDDDDATVEREAGDSDGRDTVNF
jgi:hypothetical protein